MIPGGFGWLKSDAEVCGVAVSLAAPTVPSKPGLSQPRTCSSSYFGSLIGKTLLLPVLDDAGRNGNNGRFHISGFAAFQMTGYNFPGDSYNNNQSSVSFSGSCKGIIGRERRTRGARPPG